MTAKGLSSADSKDGRGGCDRGITIGTLAVEVLFRTTGPHCQGAFGNACVIFAKAC